MPQTPPPAQTPSPAHQQAVGHDTRTGSAGASSAATGSLPGGVRVEAQTGLRDTRTLQGVYHDPDLQAAASAPSPIRFMGTREWTEWTRLALLSPENVHPALRNYLVDLTAVKQEEIELTQELAKEGLTEGRRREIQAQISEKEHRITNLLEAMRAWRDAFESGGRKGGDLKEAVLVPSGDRYEKRDTWTLAWMHSEDARQQRTDRQTSMIEQELASWLAQAGLPVDAGFWRDGASARSVEIKERWQDAGYYAWTSKAKDTKSSQIVQTYGSQSIRDDWKRGKYDDGGRTTFIGFKNGSEWIVWLEGKRKIGYNLTTGELWHGLPSRFYRYLEEHRRHELRSLDVILVASPAALQRSGMPFDPRVWRNRNGVTSEMIVEWGEVAGYHVYVEDDYPALRKSWAEGKSDRDRGTTFIGLRNGAEWIAWPEGDRRTGYNLSTGELVPGYPSEAYRILEEQRGAAPYGLDLIFIAPPGASNALHALMRIPPMEAHRLLQEHARKMDASYSAADIDFDEFGRFMLNHHPKAVVARYEKRVGTRFGTHELDVETLGAALDASEERFLLVRLESHGPTVLHGSEILCFDRPGLRASMRKETAKEAKATGDHVPSASASASAGRAPTPKERLEAARLEIIDRARDEWRNPPQRPEEVGEVPAANHPKMYSASEYDGKLLEFEKPSVILQRFLEGSAAVGIVSTGKLAAPSVPDEAMLVRQAESGDPDRIDVEELESALMFAGIKVESSADLVRFAYSTYGAWPEGNAEFVRRYVQERNDAWPEDRRIGIRLEVIRPGQALPQIDGEPNGYLIQFRRGGRLINVTFHRSAQGAVFLDALGRECAIDQLNAVAHGEEWLREGPATVLRFRGESVLPLREVGARILPQLNIDVEDAPGAHTKRERPTSMRTGSRSSVGTGLSFRPKKKERPDPDSP